MSLDHVWSQLTTWVREHGGMVHDALALTNDSTTGRGLVATRAILQHEVLIQLPIQLAVGGQDFPAEEWNPDNNTTASPWLRCLAAYYERAAAPQATEFLPYVQSLPEHYETVWTWTAAEVDTYLDGTTAVNQQTWACDTVLLNERYQQQVRPYLLHTQVPIPEENELEFFLKACQCISTRGFHHFQNTEAQYSGPFLLPVIDLLNHSNTHKCTTLTRTHDSFIMVAERDVLPDEEILHSYGEDLNASQFLQTFGFVPYEDMTMDTHTTVVTPAILTKTDILKACYAVLDSEIPNKIIHYMKEHDIEDEVWPLPSDRKRTADWMTDYLVIHRNDPLTDELVTLATLPFLPAFAYREASQALLDHSVVQDYFLGKLVGTCLLRATQNKLATYRPIDGREDETLLAEILQQPYEQWTTAQRRMAYGLTIRLQEKSCLKALVQQVVALMDHLDDDVKRSKEE